MLNCADLAASIESGGAAHRGATSVNQDLARPVLTGDRDHVVDRLGEVRVRVELFSATPTRPVAVLAFDDAEVGPSPRHACTFCRISWRD
jgi:hypothetical protein